MSVHVLTFFEMFSASFLILLTYSQRHRRTRRQASVVKQDESFPSDQVNLDPSCFLTKKRSDSTSDFRSITCGKMEKMAIYHCSQAETNLLLEKRGFFHSRRTVHSPKYPDSIAFQNH